MNVVSTTIFRNNLNSYLRQVFLNETLIIGRRNKPEAIVIKYPEYLNKKVSGITNINANSSSFTFLKDEPDLYSVADLKKKYV